MDIRYHKKLLGVTDVSLSIEGSAQADTLSRFLLTLKPDVCVSSPLERCLETAQPCVKSLGLNLETDPGLREADFGKWECMGFDEITREYPDKVSAMSEFDPAFVFPEGDSIRFFMDRILNTVSKWTRSPEDTVALFTHAGVIRFAVCQLMGIDPKHHVAFEINYASVVVINLFEEKGVLEAVIPVTAMKRAVNSEE